MRVYEQLSELYFLHFSVCLWLLDTQSFHQPAVLLSSNAECFVLTARPLELALFKALVEQEKAVALPVERLDSVGSPAAEQEQRVGTRVKPELLFNDGCQSIDPTAKIGVAASEVDLRSAEIALRHRCFRLLPLPQYCCDYFHRKITGLQRTENSFVALSIPFAGGSGRC